MLYTDFLFIFSLVSTLVDTKLPLFLWLHVGDNSTKYAHYTQIEVFVKTYALMSIFSS